MTTTTEANEDYWARQDEAIAAIKALIGKGLKRREIAKGTRKRETAPLAFNFSIPRAADNERF